MGTWLLPNPLQVNNVDRTINQEGSITRYCNLWLKQGNKTVKLGFYIANLGHNHLILVMNSTGVDILTYQKR
jgi:hypothetical protein